MTISTVYWQVDMLSLLSLPVALCGPCCTVDFAMPVGVYPSYLFGRPPQVFFCVIRHVMERPFPLDFQKLPLCSFLPSPWKFLALKGICVGSQPRDVSIWVPWTLFHPLPREITVFLLKSVMTTVFGNLPKLEIGKLKLERVNIEVTASFEMWVSGLLNGPISVTPSITFIKGTYTCHSCLLLITLDFY